MQADDDLALKPGPGTSFHELRRSALERAAIAVGIDVQFDWTKADIIKALDARNLIERAIKAHAQAPNGTRLPNALPEFSLEEEIAAYMEKVRATKHLQTISIARKIHHIEIDAGTTREEVLRMIEDRVRAQYGQDAS